MTREEAKDLFRKDKDAYGKPKSIMKKIDMIFDDFEKEKRENRLTEFNNKNTDFRDNNMESQQEYFGK